MIRCCICNYPIEGYGNNPDGAAWLDDDGKIVYPEFGPEERCCDSCNDRFVIPGRLLRIRQNGNKNIS